MLFCQIFNVIIFVTKFVLTTFDEIKLPFIMSIPTSSFTLKPEKNKTILEEIIDRSPLEYLSSGQISGRHHGVSVGKG